MKFSRYSFFFFCSSLLILSNFITTARLLSTSPHPCKRAYSPYIGPEIYHISRTREGGTEQKGTMYGVHGGFDYLKRFSFYWGIDGYYAKGDLTGKSGSGSKIKSHASDGEIEGRGGYTLQSKSGMLYWITPYVGYGYFQENNHFLKKHPMPIHFKNKFKYFSAGFLSGIYLTPRLNVGISFAAKFMTKGVNEVSNDPEYKKVSIHMENKTQYDVELPITYQFCSLPERMEFSLIPFYRFRHYGGRINYPFDFLDTTFRIWGGRAAIIYRF